MKKCVDVQRSAAKHCLLANNKALILVMFFTLLGTGCTSNASDNHQSPVNQTQSQTTVKNPQEIRRTRERQGESNFVLPSKKNNLPALKIGVLRIQNATKQAYLIKYLEEYLESYLGRKIDFQIAKNYPEIVDLLAQNKLDVAYLGATTYLEALEKGVKVEPLVAPIDKYTGQPWYRACIIVRVDSQIKTLNNLKGKRVAFVNQSSIYEYLMLLGNPHKLGIETEWSFAQIINTGSYDQTISALDDGIVDAAAINIFSYLETEKDAKLTANKFRILWKSPPIPPSPIVVSQKLSPKLIKQLKLAFISSPDGLEDIVETESDGYTLVSPSDYTSIEQIRQDLNLISIPTK